ncbi:MAG: GNAT family N-acetyltransferase [Pseudomonadota bacterium]
MTVSLTGTPILETERLTLRAPQPGDYPVWEAFYGSPRAQYIGGPGGVREAWRGFCHVAGMWVLRGYGSFILCAKGTDIPLGMVGPWHPADWPEREIGWTIWAPDAEGKGYAYEAALASRAYAYDVLGWDTAVSYIDGRNARSIALAERMGALRDPAASCPPHAAKNPDIEDLVYRHPAPETLR